jgi:dTDP-4-dehydrorhamnose 3,5-epimerase
MHSESRGEVTSGISVNRPANDSDRADRGASLLDQTLAAASQDKQTVTPEGKTISSLVDGVLIRDAPTHVDARGSVVEIYDLRWGWHPAPMVSAHCFTIRPGFVKGWGLHKTHEDRYFILQGSMDLVLYDPRPDSPTYGHVSKIPMSELNRRLVNIPKFVWHAEHNVGTTDVVVIDLPTKPYDHANPDKYRLPIDTPLIPFSFGTARGW